MKINLNSALGSELIYYKEEGNLELKKDYAVIKTLNDPTSYRGNQFILEKPPVSIPDWKAKFSEEFKNIPKVKHITISWETENVECSQLNNTCDLNYHCAYVLKMGPSKLVVKENNEIESKLVSTDQEWLQVAKTQIPESEQENENFLNFFKHHFSIQKNLVGKSKALWLIANIDGQYAGSLGLMYEENIARFQSVYTHPDHRKKGVCSNLMMVAMSKLSHINTFIIVTDDEHESALRLYQNLGFEIQGTVHTLYKWA